MKLYKFNELPEESKERALIAVWDEEKMEEALIAQTEDFVLEECSRNYTNKHGVAGVKVTFCSYFEEGSIGVDTEVNLDDVREISEDIIGQDESVPHALEYLNSFDFNVSWVEQENHHMGEVLPNSIELKSSLTNREYDPKKDKHKDFAEYIFCTWEVEDPCELLGNAGKKYRLPFELYQTGDLRDENKEAFEGFLKEVYQEFLKVHDLYLETVKDVNESFEEEAKKEVERIFARDIVYNPDDDYLQEVKDEYLFDSEGNIAENQ